MLKNIPEYPKKNDHNGRFFALLHFQFFLVDFMGFSVGLVKDKDSQSSHGRYDDWDIRFDSSLRWVPEEVENEGC